MIVFFEVVGENENSFTISGDTLQSLKLQRSHLAGSYPPQGKPCRVKNAYSSAATEPV